MDNAATLMRMVQVLEVVPVSRQTLWRWVDSGKFPKPVKIGGTPFWRRSDIEKVMGTTKRNNNEDLI